jgi:predicted unusual protein kinase regulating ubiquinone biosynthesis (AarF/ABC1/UbiB family)
VTCDRDTEEHEHIPSVPTTRLARGSILGAAAARATAKKAGLAVSQPFRSKASQERAAQKTDQEIAALLFDACTRLRGSTLKLAQVLSMECELVPAAYRQRFAQAANDVPPINRALVRKILLTELGDPSEVFSRFEYRPFAAASLGQVHAAISRSGVPLAVKVQYPGAADSFASDLALLRAVLSPTRYGRYFATCFDEIASRFAEELDYRKEAEQTAWFRGHLGMADVVVPEVHPALCTERVLTTTRMTGKHIDAWLAGNPPQSERDRLGQLLVDLFNHMTFVTGTIHADPNVGNYLFREDGKLGLLDFGCVKRLEPGFVEAARNIHQSTDEDPVTIEALHRHLGVVYRHDVPASELQEFLCRWGAWLREPYRELYFDFANGDEYFRRGEALGRQLYDYLLRYESSFLYYGRADHGLMRLLQRLRARVRMVPPFCSMKNSTPASPTPCLASKG